MGFKLKNTLRFSLSLLLAVLLLWLCFKNMKWQDFRQALNSCNWAFVALSMAVGVLSFWLRAVRWRMLLLPLDKSVGKMTCFNAVNISYAANLVFPRLGELVRCGYISSASQKDKAGSRAASFDKVLGTVVLEKSLDTLILMLLLALTLALSWKSFGTFFGDNVFGKIRLSWFLPCLAFLGLCAIGALHFLKDRFRAAALVWGFIVGIWQGVKSCIRMKRAWLFVMLSFGIWACYWMTAATIILALKGSASVLSETVASLDLMDAFALMTVGAISSLVPVPGGFGAYHYLVSLALQSVYGIAFSSAMVFATLSHESQTLIQILCGGASYLYECGRRRTGDL